MKVDNVGINVDYWKDKTFEEFSKALKGKVRSDKIKPAYNKLKELTKPKAKPKAKEVIKDKK
jgi:hypothetical protein|tara:strand:+ start:7733 stop:7918 length:186 start_codon:yes stop_codon:yes gene_type:complete